LHKVLDRMPQHGLSQVALPRTLPEWKYVDESAPFWALRHYQRRPEDSGRFKDYTLPDDPDATGLAVNYHPSNGLELAYLSTEEKATMLQSFGKTCGFPISVQTDKPGVSLGKIDSKYLQGFPTPLFWLLGHVIPGGM
jgi:hypothetical protein